MNRKYHILSKNKGIATPQNIIFYDTETDPTPDPRFKTISRHKFKMVASCYVRINRNCDIIREQWQITKKLNDFHEFLLLHAQQRQRLYVIAHNQHYDMIVAGVFPFMKKNNYEITKMIIDSGKVIVSFRNSEENKTIVFVDSINWFKAPLKSLGDSIGLPKLEMPDFKTGSEQEWEIYNKRDVEILKQYFLNYQKWVQQNNLGNFSFTIASQSFNAFRHRFMNTEIHISDDEDSVMLERESYKGGRTEAFHIGTINEKIYDLDFNSMYPSVMKDEKYPVRCIGRLFGNTTRNLRKKLVRGYGAVAKVIVDTDEPVYPYKKDGKLCFPVGEFETVLTTNELKYALVHHHLVEIKQCFIYEMENIFEGFVNYMYTKREECKIEKDVIGMNFYKLLLNSLYGKFGQKIKSMEKIENPFGEEMGTGTFIYKNTETGDNDFIRFVQGDAFIETDSQEGFNSFVGIASHVTANARLLLWNAIKQAGKDNVFYCDTDSIFTNHKGYLRLKDQMHETKLGKLKLEKISTKMRIHGLKDYVLGDVVKLKGINVKNSKKKSENEYEVTVWPKLRQMIQKSELKEYFTYTMTKKLSRVYDKGQVEKSGKVQPFELAV